MVQIINLTNQNNNHEKIKYIASNEHARSLLKYLLENNDLSYDDAREYLNLKDEQTNTILNKLVEFGMLEQSHKWAHGYTKMLALTYSTYTITDFGANFITNYDTLNNTNHESHTAQLSKGDFIKFKHMLYTFTNSDDEYQVREAYEFIFGTGSKNSNFYNLSKNKLLTTYRKLSELKRAIFVVIDIDSYQKTIKEYDRQVYEFTDIANELNITLQKDRLDIYNYLNRFLKEANAQNKTDFYERKAKQVFGVNMINNQSSEESITKIVTTFAQELINDKIINVYTDIIDNILSLAIQLGKQLIELNAKMQQKAECMTLAHEIGKLPFEEAQKVFTQTMMNKTMNYVSEDEYSHFKENVLYVQLPDPKEKKEKEQATKISRKEFELAKLKTEKLALEKKLEELNKVYNLTQKTIHNEIVDPDEYTLIKQAISKADVSEKEADLETYSLRAKTIASNQPFIVKTKSNNKIKRTVYNNKGVTFYVKGNIKHKIKKVESDIADYTTRIVVKESDQQI